MRLKDKVIVVTAATRGIGAACVKACAEEGAIVYIGARRLEFAQQQADEYNAQGYRVKAVYSDASKIETHAQMIEEVVKAEGRIDGLINNYGHSDPRIDKDFKNTSFEDMIECLDNNLAAVYLCSQTAAKYMAQQETGGSIVNISSVAGNHPDVSQIGYGMSKASINYLTQLIAVHCARDNVRCNAVEPGMTATEAVANNLTDAFQDFFLKHTPIRRMGKPAEIAGAAVYFLSDDAAFVTGQIIEVSGGFGLPTPVYGDTMEAGTKR